MKSFKRSLSTTHKLRKVAAIMSAALLLAPVAVNNGPVLAATNTKAQPTLSSAKSQDVLSKYRAAYKSLTTTQAASYEGQQLRNLLHNAQIFGNANASDIESMLAETYTAASSINSSNATYHAALDKALTAALNTASQVNSSPLFLNSYSTRKLQATIGTVVNELDANKIKTAHQAAQFVTQLTKATTDLQKQITLWNQNTGTGKVLYPKGYGIQIWSYGGQAVKNPNGSAKKLRGGTTWKIFGPELVVNGTTMYSLGGDQYIDAHYIKFTAKK